MLGNPKICQQLLLADSTYPGTNHQTNSSGLTFNGHQWYIPHFHDSYVSTLNQLVLFVVPYLER